MSMTRRISVLTIVLATSLAAAATEPDTVRLHLRSEVTVYGEVATLADVLELRDAAPELLELLANTPLRPDGAAAETDTELVVTHAEITHRLNEIGVNMARVLVAGALRCTVQVAQPAPQVVRAPPREAAPLLRGVQLVGDVQRVGRTLAEVVRDTVQAELAELGGTVELQFERASAPYLRFSTERYEFRVSTRSRNRLGLRDFRVVVRADGRVQHTLSIAAKVRLIRSVVVAARPLSIGNPVRSDDVTLETRVFDQDGELGIPQVAQAVGQQVGQFIPAGAMITSDALDEVDLVKRSSPVIVVTDNGGVQARVSGVARDSGAYGEVIRVRVGSGRKERRELRGVVTGVGEVRLVDGN
jgi:flagella basal body P-ring formation protein FlgA